MLTSAGFDGTRAPEADADSQPNSPCWRPFPARVDPAQAADTAPMPVIARGLVLADAPGAVDEGVTLRARTEQRRRSIEREIEQAARLLLEGDPAGAVETVHHVLTLAEGEQREQAKLLLARAYAQEPRWSRYAVSLLRELLDARPADAELLTILGRLYLREGLLARAQFALKKALDHDPAHADARVTLRAVEAERWRRQDDQRPGSETMARRRPAPRKH